jgi:hypothetical protein
MESQETTFIQTELDNELVHRCGKLMHINAYDEAVRNAFIVLEKRLQRVAGDEDTFGTRLALSAFDPDSGPLGILLTPNRSERAGK